MKFGVGCSLIGSGAFAMTYVDKEAAMIHNAKLKLDPCSKSHGSKSLCCGLTYLRDSISSLTPRTQLVWLPSQYGWFPSSTLQSNCIFLGAKVYILSRLWQRLVDVYRCFILRG